MKYKLPDSKNLMRANAQLLALYKNNEDYFNAIYGSYRNFANTGEFAVLQVWLSMENFQSLNFDSSRYSGSSLYEVVKNAICIIKDLQNG